MSDRLLYAIGTGAAVLWRIMIDIDEPKSVDDKVVQKIQIWRMVPAFYTRMTESVIQNVWNPLEAMEEAEYVLVLPLMLWQRLTNIYIAAQ